MSVTLTDEQWELLREIAEGEAGSLEYHTCNDRACKHSNCRINRPQADAIRRVIEAVEKEG